MEMPRRTASPTTSSGTITLLSLTFLLLLATGTEAAAAVTATLKISSGRVDEPLRTALAKRSISTDTVSKVFFYNPPLGDAPPLDVLQMLEHGQTFGTHNPFSTRSFVVGSNTLPKVDEIPTGDPSSGVSELFQGSGVGIRVRDNPNTKVQNYTAGITELEMSDSLDSSAVDDSAKENSSTEMGEQGESSDSPQDLSNTDLSTIPSSDTELPMEFTTNSEFLNVEETTTVKVSESTADLTDSDTEAIKIRENLEPTEPSKKNDFTPTEETFEMTTENENEDEKPTALPVVEEEKPTLPSVGSQQDLRLEEETTVHSLGDDSQEDTADYEGETTAPSALDDSQPNSADNEDEETTVHSVVDEDQEDLEEVEETNITSLTDNPQKYITDEEEEEAKKYSNIELLKTNDLIENWNNYNRAPDIEYDEAVNSQRDSETEMTGNVNQDTELHEKLHELSGGNLNTILFTIEDERDGQLRVKVGKALNYATNKNTIHKQGNFKDNVYQYHFHDPNTGWYKFGYGGDNQWRHEERRADGVVLGRYGWHDANGQDHTTHFVADARGYRVVQPGQEIIMHVAAPTSPPRIQTVNPTPAAITTVQPFFTRQPTITSDASTTSTFPVASLSTTVTFASPSLPTGPPKRPVDDHSSPVPQVVPYPGTLNELVSPPPDSYVVTGRPPIAYPLPHQSVSHRPGSWVYVTPSPQYQESSRPPVRPPFRPFRPNPDRPIKSPFRPVNRPRPKPLRPRPLKPLQPNLNTGSRPTDDSEEDDDSLEQTTGNLPLKGQGVVNSTASVNTDLIGAIQTLLNNPSKYPIVYGTHPQASDENYIPDYPIPSNIPGGSQAGTDNEQSSSQNPSNLSSEDLLHFINLINSLKGQGQATAASPNRPVWSLSPWASSSIKIPPGHFSASGPSLPASALRPPPSSFSSSPSTVHDVFQAHQHQSHYPLDYAFMDEDYVLPDINPLSNSGGVQIKPAGSNNVEENTLNVKPGAVPGTSYLTRIPVRPTGTNAVTQNMNENSSSSDYVGSVVWKLPVLGPLEVETPQNTQTQDIETDNGVSITVDKDGLNPSTASDIEKNKPQITKDTGISSTSVTPSTSTSPSTSSVLTSTPSTSTITATSETSEPPATDSVWPYISIQPFNVTTPTANQTATAPPPPPPPQNFWTELLKRIYYWPMMGKERRPTLQ